MAQGNLKPWRIRRADRSKVQDVGQRENFVKLDHVSSGGARGLCSPLRASPRKRPRPRRFRLWGEPRSSMWGDFWPIRPPAIVQRGKTLVIEREPGWSRCATGSSARVGSSICGNDFVLPGTDRQPRASHGGAEPEFSRLEGVTESTADAAMVGARLRASHPDGGLHHRGGSGRDRTRRSSPCAARWRRGDVPGTAGSSPRARRCRSTADMATSTATARTSCICSPARASAPGPRTACGRCGCR
jgi:hypothetical protein